MEVSYNIDVLSIKAQSIHTKFDSLLAYIENECQQGIKFHNMHPTELPKEQLQFIPKWLQMFQKRPQIYITPRSPNLNCGKYKCTFPRCRH